MFSRPILICAVGVVALQLLRVNAAAVIPVDPPKGWAVSDSIGKQYRLGYDPVEKAYFIENSGPIEPAGKAVNADTVPLQGGQHVPYSAAGLKAADPWAASLLQSIKATPYRGRKLRLEAEVKMPALFKCECNIMLRGEFPDGTTTSNTSPSKHQKDWQTLVAEIDEVPNYDMKADNARISFGVLLQGEGLILIRGVKLTSLPIEPKDPHHHRTGLEDMFADPPAASEPVNLELRP